MVDPDAREAVVIQLLTDWPWRTGTTLIGGYSLAAYGGARHSIDVDFVVPSSGVAPVTDWLKERGYSESVPRGRGGLPFANAQRFEREPVTVDLLVDFVRDREASVDIPEQWIARESLERPLVLLSGLVAKPARVARPEAIWALKLQAGRDQDLIDLFAISKVPVSAKEVRELFRSLAAPTLTAKLKRVLEKVGSNKLYADARSLLGIRDVKATQLRWERFCATVADMIPHDGEDP